MFKVRRFLAELGKDNTPKSILFVFILLTLLTCSFVYKIEKAKVENFKEKVAYMTIQQAGKTAYVVQSLLSSTSTLKALLIQGNGQIKDFDKLAPIIFDSKYMNNLTLAPNGIVDKVYPYESNKMLIGKNLLTLPNQAVEAEFAKNVGILTMTGPIDLIQGGKAVIGRMPIYLPNNKGIEEFWGFATITLKSPEFLEAAQFNRFCKDGLDYELWRIDPNSHHKQIINKSENQLIDPITVKINVPNGEWRLSVAPTNGWFNYREMAFRFFIAIFISLLGTVLYMSFVALNKQRGIYRILSMSDMLTNLPNRRALFGLVNKYITYNRRFTLCFLDLNKFKEINDSYGHDAGDSILVEAGKRMSSCLSEIEKVFRIAGDEFVIILPEVSENKEIAEKIISIKKAINQPMIFNDIEVILSVSIGTAKFPDEGKTADELLKIADAKMYNQKQR